MHDDSDTTGGASSGGSENGQSEPGPAGEEPSPYPPAPGYGQPSPPAPGYGQPSPPAPGYGQEPYRQPPAPGGGEPYPPGYGQPGPPPPGPYGGGPYGAPPYGTPPYGAPPYGAPPYGQAPYGAPGWGPGAPATPFASWGRRVGGWLLDFLIVAAVTIAIDIPLGLGRHLRTVSPSGHVVHSFRPTGFGLVTAAIAILYGLLCGSTRGQTPGMMAVGVRAVRADNGGPIGYGRALGRGALEYVLFLLIVLPWVLDMLFPLWDAQRQTLHDKATGTVVILQGSGGGPPGSSR